MASKPLAQRAVVESPTVSVVLMEVRGACLVQSRAAQIESAAPQAGGLENVGECCYGVPASSVQRREAGHAIQMHDFRFGWVSGNGIHLPLMHEKARV